MTDDTPTGCIRRPFVIGKCCTCGKMYKPSKGGRGDDNSGHESSAKAEIERKREEFPGLFILAPFRWDGCTCNGVNLIDIDRMGEYSDLWEGSNLHSNDALPTNMQQYLSPNDSTNITDNNTANHQSTSTDVQDPIDIEVDKLDGFGLGGATHEPYPTTTTDVYPEPDAEQDEMPSPHKPPGSAKMYADAIGSAGPTDHRPAVEPVLRPNLETQAADFNRLLREDVVAKGPEVHKEWGGACKGDDQDRIFLSTDSRRSNQGGQQQPARQVSKTRPDLPHPLIAPFTRSASHTPSTSLHPRTGQREAAPRDQAADQGRMATAEHTAKPMFERSRSLDDPVPKGGGRMAQPAQPAKPNNRRRDHPAQPA